MLPFYSMIRSLMLSSALACTHPTMLGPLFLGRLILFTAGANIIKDFVNNVYEPSDYIV